MLPLPNSLNVILIFSKLIGHLFYQYLSLKTVAPRHFTSVRINGSQHSETLSPFTEGFLVHSFLGESSCFLYPMCFSLWNFFPCLFWPSSSNSFFRKTALLVNFLRTCIQEKKKKKTVSLHSHLITTFLEVILIWKFLL